MNTHLENCLAEIDAKIASLTTLRATLVTFQREFPHTAASLVRAVPKKARTKKRRTAPTPRPPAPKSLGDGSDADRSVDILAALTRAGGSMTAWDLRTAVGAKEAITLRHWLKPLLESKKVIATGATLSRRFSLPGRVPKEGL